MFKVSKSKSPSKYSVYQIGSTCSRILATVRTTE